MNCSCILVLVVGLTIFADLMQRSHVRRRQQSSMNPKSSINPPDITASMNGGIMWLELLNCFHLPTNYKRLMELHNNEKRQQQHILTGNASKMAQKRSYFALLTGMRTIICLWITVFHVYYYSLYAMSNTPFIIAKLENLILQPIIQSCFYVDVFFIMRWNSITTAEPSAPSELMRSFR